MTRFKKITVLLIAAALMFVAGCSKPAVTDNPNPTATPTAAESRFNAPGTFPIMKEKVKLTITIPQASTVEDFETNTMTKLLEEKGNFDLAFTTIPTAEYHTKLNLMVASGGDELTDIVIASFDDSQVYNYATAGAIIPLTKYYKNPSMAYYINDAIKRTKTDFLPMITSPDGEIYGLPKYNQSISNEYSSKMYLYSKWLDNLGLKEPTTPDELYNVLKAFKTQDPNGNKQQDEIPLVGHTKADYWIEYLMNPFVYAGDDNYLTVNKGVVGAAYTTDAWREGLRYMKKLVNEGLLSPLSFTQDDKAYYALQNNPTTIVGGFVQMGPSGITATDKRRVEYKGIVPLKGSNGTQYASYVPGVADIGMVVTKNCKDPEAAFKFGDLMVSEEFSIMTRWGEKGVDYLEPAPGDKSLYDSMGYKPSLKEVLPWGPRQNKHWSQNGPYVRQYSISAGVVWSGNPLDTNLPISKAQALYSGKKPDEVIPKLILKPEENDAISETLTTLNTYVKESLANFVTGGMDLDKDWDSYKKQLETIGVSKVVKTVQTVYDRMYKTKK